MKMGLGLYDYQLDAIDKMKNGCILCGGVGSGKSRTALGYYYKQNGGDVLTNDHSFEKGKPTFMDLYIITTAHKRDLKEWELDMAPFLLSPDSNLDIYSHKVIIDSWNNIQKYTDVQDAFFIFDEQRLVGRGVWVKSFLKIAKVNQWILLTATPGDTWSDYIPVFIANGFYRNRTQFNSEHIVWSRFTKFPKVDRYISTGKLIKFRNDILVDMDFHRHTKRHHEDIFCDFDAVEYKSVIKNRWNYFDDKPIENASELCYQMRKVVNSCADRELKILELYEIHKKIIIFYNFDYELEILRSLCKASAITYAEWNGHKHESLPKTDSWFYLVQYTAGSEGWNCTETDTMIFFSQNYSYKTLEQAMGRIDRLNTPYEDLYYYHLKSRAGIDIAISKALNNKKTFNESRYVNKNFMNKERIVKKES